MADDSRDPYIYPGGSVLVNKAGLRDQPSLDKFERGATSLRLAELRGKPISGDFNLAHMQAIHKQTFKDVYAWAGEVRNVDIYKGKPGDRSFFTHKEDIPRVVADVHREIKDANYLRGMDKEQFTSAMAKVYAGLNTAHPFREGNGRATREYMYQLGKQAGYELDYTKVDKQQWNEAAKKSFEGQLAPMKEVFDRTASPSRAIAFDTLSQKEALARHPELDTAYKALISVRERLPQDMTKEDRATALTVARNDVAAVLREGKLPDAKVTLEESRGVIDHAAASRGLMIRDAERLSGEYKGEVVAVSSRHAMLKVGESIAVRYERDNLDRKIEPGDQVAIQYNREGSQVRAPSDGKQAPALDAQPKARESKMPESGTIVVDGFRATQIEYERTHVKVPAPAQLDKGQVVVKEESVTFNVRLKEGGKEVARFENLTQGGAAQIVGEANAQKMERLAGAREGDRVRKVEGAQQIVVDRGQLSGSALSGRDVSVQRENEIQKDVAASRAAIRDYAEKNGLSVRQPVMQYGTYSGQVAEVTDKHVLQRLSGTVAIEHEKGRLDRGVAVGDRVSVQYSQGEAKVLDQNRAKDIGRSGMQMEREISGR